MDLIPVPGPVEEVEQRITDAESLNRKVQENDQRKAMESQLVAKREESRKLTEAINAIDTAKAKKLANTAFPVPGLGFSETGVTFSGLPLEQASGAEQLRISAAIGLAMNPKLRVLLIRDGSLLDDTGLELLRDLAQEHDAQIWLERVDNGAECTVVIEAGQLVSPAPEVEPCDSSRLAGRVEYYLRISCVGHGFAGGCPISANFGPGSTWEQRRATIG